MKKDKRVYEEDDGRTIADMSGVSRPNVFLPRLPPRRQDPKPASPPEPAGWAAPWEEGGLSREERRWYILGALKAALLIALAFGAGLGLIVLLFYLFA